MSKTNTGEIVITWKQTSATKVPEQIEDSITVISVSNANTVHSTQECVVSDRLRITDSSPAPV